VTSTPFQYSSGPRNARVIIVGEAWGKSEDEYKKPFAGESGKELWRMLGEAFQTQMKLHERAAAGMQSESLSIWLSLREEWLAACGVLFTNTLNLRPQDNKIESLCCKKAECGPGYYLPPIRSGKYLRPEYLPEIDRLKLEILEAKPNLVVALGATAVWALLGSGGISAVRGTAASAVISVKGVTDLRAPPRVKVIPTFHPAYVLRAWQHRPIVIADLTKCERESHFPEVIRPGRQVLVNPTISEIVEWFSRPATLYSVDIETGSGQIKCIGFARSRDDSIVIPFVDMGRPGRNYWSTLAEEVEVWQIVKRVLEGPIPKLGQNFLYDIQYLMRAGIRPMNVMHDTMLLHHSLYPEMQKGLGFLGSIYTNEPAWKLMRHEKADTEKRDE
jgi:uracil-DNA glycosylase